MKLNTTPRVGVNDPQLTRELRNVATAVNLLADGRMAGTNNAATAAPTTGTHALGDFVRNSNPTGGAPIFGWLCTVGGTPGTWVAVAGGTGGGVSSVGMTVPTGLSVSGSPITSTGTLAVVYSAGYSIPTDASQANWNTAYGWGNHATAGYATTAGVAAGYVALTGNQTVAGEKTFSSPTVITVNSASDGLRITQTGAGNALLVEDAANPDTTPLMIDASGRIVIGHTAALTRYYDPQTTTQRNPTFQRHGAAVEGAGAAFTSWSASAGGFYAPALWLAKSKSATVGTNTIVASGERLGTLMFSGDDGAKFIGAAQIQCTTDAAPALDSMPGALVFSTTASGASTSTERMRVSSIGDVRIATTTRSGTAMLTVSGEAAATSFTGAGTGLTGTGASFTAGAATNVAGGAANKIVYQTGAGATGFIDAPTSGSTYLRWNAGGTAFEWGTPSGGSGEWTKLVDTDTMASNTRWTSRSGTWTFGGTYGVNQTAAGDNFIELTSNVPTNYSIRAIQAILRITGGANKKAGFAFCNTGGGWSADDLAFVYNQATGNLEWDRHSTGGGTASLGVSLSLDTDYTIKVVEVRRPGTTITSPQGMYLAFLNGTLVTQVEAGANKGTLALFARDCTCWYRDVTVWGGYYVAMPT